MTSGLQDTISLKLIVGFQGQRSTKSLYTKSLVNATFWFWGKIVLTKFHVNQVKWYQFVQNQVKSVLVNGISVS